MARKGSAMNGTQLASKLIARLTSWSNAVYRAWPNLWNRRTLARLAFVAMLLWLVVSLTGCAATSTPSDFTPRNPPMPRVSQSQPSETYSSRASANIKAWRKSLTDTLPTR